MRREAVFSLLGFLGGFVVAALVFWNPAGSPESAPGTAAQPANAAALREPDAAGGIGRSLRPVVIPAENSGVPEPFAAVEAAPKRPAELFHDALAALPGLDATRRQAVLNDLNKKLRAAGPEGLQAIRDYFRAGKDVKFQGGYAMSNGRFTQAPSLRVAMLEALSDWPGSEAVELTRDLLRSTPQMSEASIAIRQLEAKAPGVYRAEAIETLQQLAAAAPDKGASYDNGSTLFDALGYFKAAELIPAAEKLVQKNGWAAGQFLQALGNFPPDVREPAMDRLFSDPNVVKQLASNPWALQSLNYGEPVVSRNVAQLFATGMDKKGRERFLQSFGSSSGAYVSRSTFSSGNPPVAAPPASDSTRVALLQSKMAFLDGIAPECTTAVLQERLADAREEVKKAIENPAAPKAAATMIQMGGGVGDMVIQSDGISVIQGSGGAVIKVQTEK